MEFIKHFSIGGMHLYVTNCKMRPPKSDTQKKRSELFRKFKVIREARYRKSGGVCEECGQVFSIEKMELHHIVPMSENPRLATSSNNLQLVCQECHARLHGRNFRGGYF